MSPGMSPGISAGARCRLTDAKDPLCALNQGFRDAYASARRATVQDLEQSAGPVIISRFDRVILIRDGRQQSGRTIDDVYHRLKSLAHVPLAVHMLLYPGADRPLDARTRDQLEKLDALIATVRPSAGKDLTEDQTRRQESLLDGSSAFIERVLGAGRVGRDELRTFTRAHADAVLDNAREAAEHQLGNLHRHVSTWLKDMTPEQRERLSVVVQVGHMPRIGSLTSQYFSAVLGEPYEGRFDVENVSPDARVIIAEGRGDNDQLMRLLATHVVDTRIGVDFFADGERMHRDLLADATEQWIIRTLAVQPASDALDSPDSPDSPGN